MMRLDAIRARLAEERAGGWLVWDFRGNNPVLAQLLPAARKTTRRTLLWIPAAGGDTSAAQPRLLAHMLDASQFAALSESAERGGAKDGRQDACPTVDTYTGWRDLHAWLAQHVAPAARVAMEYSAGGALPVVSVVDGGTIELVRSLGVEVVSSANLVQVSVAVWSEAARREHGRAACEVTGAKDAAFALIRERLAAGAPVTELDVQRHILAAFEKVGLEWPDPPIVAVNAHSGDPHYDTSQTKPAPIRRGDWVLIDLWARRPGDEHIFSDITWVGFSGAMPTARHREVFNAVKAARDAAVGLAQSAWKEGRPLQGWQLDEAAAATIRARGFGEFIKHRTGHSLSPGPRVHGVGMNLDNLETRDTRTMLPGLGFTIEPGIYLPEFGVRLEINMFVEPTKGPVVTSCMQDEIVLLG